MKQVFVRRSGQSLVPVSSMDAEIIEGLTSGREMTARLTSRRSLPHHRKYFGILSLALKHTKAGDIWPTVDHLHASLMHTTGRVRPVKVMVAGKWETRLERDSAAFDAMDQGEFADFYGEAMMALAAILGVDVETLEREASDA